MHHHEVVIANGCQPISVALRYMQQIQLTLSAQSQAQDLKSSMHSQKAYNCNMHQLCNCKPIYMRRRAAQPHANSGQGMLGSFPWHMAK